MSSLSLKIKFRNQVLRARSAPSAKATTTATTAGKPPLTLKLLAPRDNESATPFAKTVRRSLMSRKTPAGAVPTTLVSQYLTPPFPPPIKLANDTDEQSSLKRTLTCLLIMMNNAMVRWIRRKTGSTIRSALSMNVVIVMEMKSRVLETGIER